MATESQPLVVGDIWADNDPRNKGVLVEIKDVDDTHVTLFRPSTGRTSRVKRERMRPIATGYIFVESPLLDGNTDLDEFTERAASLPRKDVVVQKGLIGSDMLGASQDDIDALNEHNPRALEDQPGHFTTKNGGEIVGVEPTPNKMDSFDVDTDRIDEVVSVEMVGKVVPVSEEQEGDVRHGFDLSDVRFDVEESHVNDDGVKVIDKVKVHSAGYSAHTHDDRGIVEKIATARTALEKADADREDALAKGHKDLGPFPLEKINRRSHFWFAGRFYRWITGKRGGAKGVRETDTKTLHRLHDKGIR